MQHLYTQLQPAVSVSLVRDMSVICIIANKSLISIPSRAIILELRPQQAPPPLQQQAEEESTNPEPGYPFPSS